jgi:hypothetical protein
MRGAPCHAGENGTSERKTNRCCSGSGARAAVDMATLWPGTPTRACQAASYQSNPSKMVTTVRLKTNLASPKFARRPAFGGARISLGRSSTDANTK